MSRKKGSRWTKGQRDKLDREARRVRAKKQWQDGRLREAVLAGLRRRWADPRYRKMMEEVLRRNNRIIHEAFAEARKRKS